MWLRFPSLVAMKPVTGVARLIMPPPAFLGAQSRSPDSAMLGNLIRRGGLCAKPFLRASKLLVRFYRDFEA